MIGPAEWVRWTEPVGFAAVAAGLAETDYNDFEAAMRISVLVVAAAVPYFVEDSVEYYLHQMETLDQSCW